MKSQQQIDLSGYYTLGMPLVLLMTLLALAGIAGAVLLKFLF